MQACEVNAANLEYSATQVFSWFHGFPEGRSDLVLRLNIVLPFADKDLAFTAGNNNRNCVVIHVQRKRAHEAKLWVFRVYASYLHTCTHDLSSLWMLPTSMSLLGVHPLGREPLCMSGRDTLPVLLHLMRCQTAQPAAASPVWRCKLFSYGHMLCMGLLLTKQWSCRAYQ